MQLLDRLPFFTVLLLCLTVGLAPFAPEPHVWEKLKMLVAGQLSAPMDIFDLALHGAPWAVLGLKGLRALSGVKTP